MLVLFNAIYVKWCGPLLIVMCDVAVRKGAWCGIDNDVVDCNEVLFVLRSHWNHCALSIWCALRRSIIELFDANHEVWATLMVRSRYVGRVGTNGALASGAPWEGVSSAHFETPPGAHKWCMDYAKQIMKPYLSVCLGEDYTFHCPRMNPVSVTKLLMEIFDMLTIECKATINDLISSNIKLGNTWISGKTKIWAYRNDHHHRTWNCLRYDK